MRSSTVTQESKRYPGNNHPMIHYDLTAFLNRTSKGPGRQWMSAVRPGYLSLIGAEILFIAKLAGSLLLYKRNRYPILDELKTFSTRFLNSSANAMFPTGPTGVMEHSPYSSPTIVCQHIRTRSWTCIDFTLPYRNVLCNSIYTGNALESKMGTPD